MALTRTVPAGGQTVNEALLDTLQRESKANDLGENEDPDEFARLPGALLDPDRDEDERKPSED